MSQLQQLARPAELDGMARFGINPAGRLGASIPSLRALGKAIGRDHALALQLAATDVPDAQILAAYVAEPARLTVREMNAWVAHLSSWDTCDQACSNAFARSPLAWGRVPVWAADAREYVRRAGFALIAALAVHDKAADDARFLACLPLIEAAADDERNFVKKAVNWALRQIGKRNAALRPAALALAQALMSGHQRSARWIGRNAWLELSQPARRPTQSIDSSQKEPT